MRKSPCLSCPCCLFCSCDFSSSSSTFSPGPSCCPCCHCFSCCLRCFYSCVVFLIHVFLVVLVVFVFLVVNVVVFLVLDFCCNSCCCPNTFYISAFSNNNVYSLKHEQVRKNKSPPLAPVKGAQVLKVGRFQRRLSQKHKFVLIF